MIINISISHTYLGSIYFEKVIRQTPPNSKPQEALVVDIDLDIDI